MSVGPVDILPKMLADMLDVVGKATTVIVEKSILLKQKNKKLSEEEGHETGEGGDRQTCRRSQQQTKSLNWNTPRHREKIARSRKKDDPAVCSLDRRSTTAT